jgi:hypothetical protein
MAQAIAIGFTSLILTKMYNVSTSIRSTKRCVLISSMHSIHQELTEAMEVLEPGDVSAFPMRAFLTI